MAVSYKVTHTLTIRPSHFTARYLSKKNENICLHKDLDMNSNTIHKNQRLGRTRMPIASKGIKSVSLQWASAWRHRGKDVDAKTAWVPSTALGSGNEMGRKRLHIGNSRKGAALAIECRSVLSRLAGEEFGLMGMLYGIGVLT